MTRIKERQLQYLKPNAGVGTLSHDLVESARHALMRALQDRRQRVVRFARNHYSANAPAALVLMVTALDVSMNEVVAMTTMFGRGTDKRLALLPTCKKFLALTATARSAKRVAIDLRRLVDARDEIIHFLPRQIQTKNNVPTWFRALHNRGLFIHAPGVDFQFAQKLPSYALAYWGWEVGFRAIELVVRATPHAKEICDYVTHNFGLFRSICPPAQLHEYDKKHALSLTNFAPTP